MNRDGIQAQTIPDFNKVVLSEEFFGEGAAFGDINGDGHTDVVSGPYWYSGPKFNTRHEYTLPQRFNIRGYSKHFFSWTHDFNHDGHLDILVVGFPSQAGYWYENPGSTLGHWRQHLALDEVSNESPTFVDVTGDGEPELVCTQSGRFGYSRVGNDPSSPWKFVPVSPPREGGLLAHGLGVGDVDGDGRQDILEAKGWWQQKADLGALFEFQEFPFADTGGSQMYAYDFDGDGDQDVVSVQNAHQWGIKWFERRGADNDFLFVPHTIMSESRADNPQGLAISQMHALALVDMDNDGVKDLVTGKRFWAHSERDPGSLEPAVLFWFRTVRSAGMVEFEPHLIDLRSGVGTQLTVADINGDAHPDILVGNKLGTFVLTSVTPPYDLEPSSRTINQLDLPKIQRIGAAEFDQHVRSTDPLPATEEQRTFLLPDGFSIELFASEPDITKPMNMAFDTKGRLWVSSSEEYPLRLPDDAVGRDTIKILEDTNGDGKADKITTFADGLNIPIGLYPYQDGVVCFSIPYIWFLRDTDGDDRADRREKLYGPFDCTRDTHGMCNSFQRGPDGWLYACHGFNNSSHVHGHDQHSVDMHSGNIFRIRLDGSRIENFAYGQVNPFGLTFDTWGDFFSADCHSKPLSLLLQGGYHNSFGKPHDGLGFVPDLMSHSHGSSGIAGVALGESTTFPQVYQDSAFLCNVVTSRVNRNRLRHVGSSVIADEEPDFLVSGDPWFRPVDLQVGPDGSMYVADFYNRIIGHYEVPLDHPGRDRNRGRIWKVTYDGSTNRRDDTSIRASRPPNCDISLLSMKDLFSALDTYPAIVGWKIVDRLTDQFGSEAEPLARVTLANSPSATVRCYSMWVLARLNALTFTEWQSASGDSAPLVRAHAFQVVQSFPSRFPNVAPELQQGLLDPDARVQRAAVMAATQIVSEELPAPLVTLARWIPAEDIHLKHAVRMAIRHQVRDPQVFTQWTSQLSSADLLLATEIALGLPTRESGDFVAKHIEQFESATETHISELLSLAGEFAGPASLKSLSEFAQSKFRENLSTQVNWIHFVRRGLRGRDDESNPIVHEWAVQLTQQLLQQDTQDAQQDRHTDSAPQAKEVNERYVMAADIAAKFGVTQARPALSAILCLRQIDRQVAKTIAANLADMSSHRLLSAIAEIITVEGSPETLWREACEAVAAENVTALGKLITPAMQVSSANEQLRLAERLCVDSSGIQHLLRAMETGHSSPHLLRQPTVQEKMLAVGTAEQKDLAEQLTRELPDEDQRIAQVIQDRLSNFANFKPAIGSGHDLFKKHCAVCHQVADQGKKVGPNLDGIGSRGLERILEDVLAPNRNVDVAFRSSTLILHDGRILIGLVRGDDEEPRITITNSQGEEFVVSRDEIAESKVSHASPMPSNLADVLTVEQLNELWTYLLSLRQ